MRTRPTTALALAVVLCALPLAACTRATSGSGVAVAGDTRVDLVTVAAPRLSTPMLDIAVGITKTQASSGGGVPDISGMISKGMAAKSKAVAASAQATAAASRRPTPAGVLTTVTVRPGSVVHKGQVLAQFDTRLLELGVQNAEAAHRKQLAQADVFASTASDLRDTRATVREQRSKLTTTKSQLEDTLAQAQAGIPKLKNAIGGLSAQIAADKAALAKLEAQLAATPAGPAHDALAGQAAGLNKKMAAEKAALAKLQAQLAQLLAAVPRLQQGLAKLQTAQGQIASGLSTLNDTIVQLESGSDITRAYAAVQEVAVGTAQAAVDQATLRAPCDGVVVSALHAGEVAFVGGPVVVIRPAGDTLVDTYLTREQLAGVQVGTSAEVRLDSVRGVLEGQVHAISADEQFPPSNYPTQIVHLSRVTRVTVSVPDTLPLGVPADVVIRP